MSTPSGKPFDPIRISDYAPKRVRDRLAAQRKSADPPVQAPEPETEAESAPLEIMPQEKSDAQPRASLAPVGPHERSREEREPRREEGEPKRQRPQVASRESDDAYSDEYARPQEGSRARPNVQGAYAAHSEAYAVDLRRLESDLEALQRGGGEEALAREGREDDDEERSAEEQPPRGQRHSRDTYIDGMRLPRSLEPSYLPPPPMRDRTNHLGAVLRVLIACVVAAPITYFLVYYFSAGRETAPTERGPRLTTVETQLAALPPMPAPQAREAPPQAPQPPPQAYQPPAPPPQAPVQAPPQQRPAPFALQSAAPNWPETRAAAPAPVTPAPPPAPVRPAVTLDPDEIAVLLKQGEQFIAAGDVVTARVPFERAAEAGDARAALALGATYDPAVLARLGVRGITADVAKARSWYEKARALGSAEAAGRLATLATR